MPHAIDYTQLAADYARHRRVHPEVLRQLAASLRPTDNVLEVGCGTGNYIFALHGSTGCACWGTDPSSEMLSQAATRSSCVQLSRGKAEVLEFPANQFDLVFSVDVIHHVHNCYQFFREADRVLKPGGKICTVTDSEQIIRHRKPLAVYFPETVTVDLARYPRREDLLAGLQDAGFLDITETAAEYAYELRDIAAYRARAFSCLQLISDAAYQRGLAQLEQALANGPIPGRSQYTLFWATKPLPVESRPPLAR